MMPLSKDYFQGSIKDIEDNNFFVYRANATPDNMLPICWNVALGSTWSEVFSIKNLDDITSKGSVPSKSFNLMSYGIPSLYIASDDSQLNEYAKNYKHAVCCSKDQLRVARDYILELKNNPIYLAEVSRNAENASNDFERYNADKFVNLYLE